MPKHQQYQAEKPREDERKKIHPVWRGIGCISMLIVPIISYFAADVLINAKETIHWIIIPEDLISNTTNDPMLFVKIVYAFIIALILFFILAVVTFIVNKFFGPKRRPYDLQN